MLRYYLTAIFGGTALIALFSYIIAGDVLGMSPLFCVLAASATTAAAFLIDALCAILTRRFARGRAINPSTSCYIIKGWEKKFHKLIRVKAWKDKIPEMGGLLVKFQKKKLDNVSDNAYIEKFLAETCYAELMHTLSCLFGFLCIFVLPIKYVLCFGLPVSVVNFILNLLPVIVQRYTRPKLMSAYKHNLRAAQAREELKQKQKQEQKQEQKELEKV